MIKDYGHEIYFYGVEGSDVTCDEFIEVSTQNILEQAYGNYDRSTNLFKQDPHDIAHRCFNNTAIKKLWNVSKIEIFFCVQWEFIKNPLLML